jgi:hypothetical protein
MFSGDEYREPRWAPAAAPAAVRPAAPGRVISYSGRPVREVMGECAEGVPQMGLDGRLGDGQALCDLPGWTGAGRC